MIAVCGLGVLNSITILIFQERIRVVNRWNLELEELVYSVGIGINNDNVVNLLAIAVSVLNMLSLNRFRAARNSK